MRFSSLEIRRQESEKVSRMICRGRKKRDFHGKGDSGVCWRHIKQTVSERSEQGLDWMDLEKGLTPRDAEVKATYVM